MKMKIILAGNFREFQNYARSHHPHPNLVYGNGVEALAGIEAEDIEVVGTFWEREDAGELYDVAKSRVRTLRQEK